jgi:uncharacterized protein
MIQVTSIETNKAERLMKALCNHFARRIPAKYEGDKGYIEFQGGKCEISVTPDRLTLQVEAESAESLLLLKQVMLDHLQRFTPDENFQIKWSELS